LHIYVFTVEKGIIFSINVKGPRPSTAPQLSLNVKTIVAQKCYIGQCKEALHKQCCVIGRNLPEKKINRKRAFSKCFIVLVMNE